MKEDRNFYITIIILIIILIIIVLLSGNIYKNKNNRVVNIDKNNFYDEISYLENKLNDFGNDITNVILPENNKSKKIS